MNQKIIFASIAIVGIIALSGLIVALTKDIEISYGSATHFSGPIDSEEGFSVDDTTVIDGSGNFDGALTGTTGTLSSTFTVSGESNLDTLVQGGDVMWVFSTTTLTAAQVCDSSVINIGVATDPVMTLTLPTAATLIADCIPTVGDHKVVLIRDAATSTLAATILLGLNIDLEGDDNGADVLAAGASVELELYTATTTGAIGILRPFTDAD